MSTERHESPASSSSATRSFDPAAAPTLPRAEAAPEVPPSLVAHPRYRIIELLGTGGMGAVYKAEHQLMERTVALKVINPSLVNSPAMVERFRREVKAAAKLAHPNIVTAHDAEQAGTSHFLVMEYVEGTNLARLVAENGPLPVAQACDYIRQAAQALQHAFEKGMVHRDIKPHNLMLTPKGQVKVLDFGLARFALETSPPLLSVPADQVTVPAVAPGATPSDSLTQTGSVVGTPDYIAPEQVRDAHTADIRADVYSLGCTLYDLLTGQAPFAAGTAIEKVMAHMERAPKPLTELRTDVPPELARVVDRMMAKDPAQRYQTPAEAAEALAPFAAMTKPAEGRSRIRRRVLVVIGALAAAVLLVRGVIYFATDNGRLRVDGDVDDVELVISKGGKEYDVVDLKNGTRVKSLPTGDYQIALKGDRADVKLDKDAFTISRAGEAVVTVKQESVPTTRDKDLEAIQGTWKAVHLEEQGATEVADEALKRAGATLSVNGNDVSWKVDPESPMAHFQFHGRIHLDPTKEPKTCDFFYLDRDARPMLGIYRVDGDRLTVCWCVEPSKPDDRPTEFSTKGKKWTLVVWQRVGKTAKLPNPKRPPGEGVPAKYRESISNGLEYLAKAQHQDGHWEAQAEQYPTAITALCGIAMLMEGSTLDEGKYANSLRKAVDWLMKRTQPDGLIGDPKPESPDRTPLFGHGYAMLFLACVYGQEENEDRRAKLEKILTNAVEYTAGAQTKHGGWGYVRAAEGENFDEGASTVVQLQSLGAARNAGIVVPKKLIDLDYLRRCTTPPGGIIYSIAQPQGGGRAPLTAAALACMYTTGDYDSDLANKWLKFCEGEIAVDGPRIGHDEFTHYYYAQVLYILGDQGYEKLFPDSKADKRLTWSKYRTALFDSLLSNQDADGSWRTSPTIGRVYSTASWLTVLQLDDANLQIYRR
jgi:uncharacterized protein (TIGR03067 family)